MESSVPIVRLTGGALTGVGPAPAIGFAALPQTVRLGRKRSPTPRLVPKFKAYFDVHRMTSRPPASTNRREKAADSLARMFLNNQYGCCVISSTAHCLGLWTGNDAPGGVIVPTDAEILSQYHSICGPGDNGCYIPDVLERTRLTGFQAGGKLYKIDGYVAVDWTDQLTTCVVLYVLGAKKIGINLPEAWLNDAVWDVTDSPIVGGHDVAPIDYDAQGVYVASWGRVYLITWRAYMSRVWLEEAYAMLSPNWYGSDLLAPNGIDATTLKADMVKLGAGELPDPGPAPIPPGPTPVPPIPPDPIPPAAYLTYQIFTAPTLEGLRQLVTDKRANNWTPQGGVFVDRDARGAPTWCQAATRPPKSASEA